MVDLPKRMDNRIYLSAREKIGIQELYDMIEEAVYADRKNVKFLIPYKEGQIVSTLCEQAQVSVKDYREDGVYMEAKCSPKERKMFSEYIIG